MEKGGGYTAKWQPGVACFASDHACCCFISTFSSPPWGRNKGGQRHHERTAPSQPALREQFQATAPGLGTGSIQLMIAAYTQCKGVRDIPLASEYSIHVTPSMHRPRELWLLLMLDSTLATIRGIA